MEAALLEHVTDDLKADPIAWPILEKMSEKDVPSVLKSYAHGQHKLGQSITLPGKDAKLEEIQAVQNRLFEAGIFTAPPSNPKDYGVLKPNDLPEGLGWDDKLADEFSAILHKHKAPKGLAADLLPLYTKALFGTHQVLKTSYDEGMAALKVEHGDKFAERQEMVKRITPYIFKNKDELDFFESTGLGDHPVFLSVMMRLAPLAQQDSSFMKEIHRSGGEMSGDDVRSEITQIMSDKNHAMYAGYWKKDPKVMAYVEELYKKAYGDKKVELT